MMNVPPILMTVHKFAVTQYHTGLVVVMLAICYFLMEDHVKVLIYKYLLITLLLCIITTSDINECSTNNGGCAHTCTNSVGSYACSCNIGFALDADNHGCIGKL